MVNETIVIKVGEVYKEIIKEKTSLNLFMLVKMDDFIDKWTLIVAANWVDPHNLNVTFDYMLSKLRKELSPEEGSQIARVGIFTPHDQLVQEFTRSVVVADSEPIRLVNAQVNGYKVHEAWIFRSIA